MAQQIKIKTGVIAVLALALVCAGCKKDSKSPATVSATDKQATLAIVQNLVKIITGGVDPSNPGVATGSIGQQPGKLKVDDISGSGCAFTEDTTYSYTIQLNDTTTVSSKGHYSLSSTCQSGNTLGTFTEIGNFTIGQTTPSLSATYNENADITVSLSLLLVVVPAQIMKFGMALNR
jgi:hypothetical protein